LPIAMGVCAIASYAVGIAAALMLRDNTGVDLHDLDRESRMSARNPATNPGGGAIASQA
jgi:hypothetical protein